MVGSLLVWIKREGNYASSRTVAKRATAQDCPVARTTHKEIKNGKRVAKKFSLSRWKEVKPSLKYRLIEQCVGKYPIAEMCLFYGVSRSGYYRYQQRKNVPEKDAMLADTIAQCQKERGKIHGYRYVHLWLEVHKSIHKNPKTILRVMRKYGLLSEVRRKRWTNCGQSIHRYANQLNRNFKADCPNQKWVTDISYIPTAQGFLYLSVIRDLFDNSIVAYQTNRQQTVTLVLDTINDALIKEKAADGLILHSDQGFQYTTQAYFNLTQAYNIAPSMSRRGNPYDNALAENFFSMLKAECISRQKIQTLEQAQLLIDDYIHFYNYERFQMKYRLTPLQKRCQTA